MATAVGLELPRTRVATLAPAVVLESSADGAVLLVLHSDGSATLVSRSGEVLWQHSRVLPGDVRLHPDGQRLALLETDGSETCLRVISTSGKAERRIVVAASSAAVDDEWGEGDPQRYAEQLLEYLPETPPVREGGRRSFLDVFSAYCVNDARSEWSAVDDYTQACFGPPLPIQLALHPDGRRAALSTPTGISLVDLDACEQLAFIEGRGISLEGLMEYGESMTALQFDGAGLLCSVGTWISGNPFVEMSCFDPDSLKFVSTHESWRHTFRAGDGDSDNVELTAYDAAAVLPAELLARDRYWARFLETHVTVWSEHELLHSISRPKGTLWMPQFDVHGFHGELLVAVLEKSHVRLRDLVSNTVLTEARLPCASDDLLWVQWSPTRQRLVFVGKDALWLWSPASGDWAQVSFDQPHAGWALSNDDAVLYVPLENGELWVCDVPPAPPLTRPTIEAAARPPAGLDDAEALQVWSDHLQDRSDRRGDLVAQQLAGESGDELLAEHPELSAGLHGFSGVTLTWSRGYVTRLEIAGGRDELARGLCLVGHEAGRYLQELEISLAEHLRDDWRQQTCDAVVEFLRRAGKPKSLARLKLSHASVSPKKLLGTQFPLLEEE